MTKICERDILYCDEGRRTPPQPPKPVEKKKKKQNKKNDKKNKGKDGGGDDEKREEETPSVVEEDQDDEEEEEEAMSWKEEEIRELEWFKERVAANSVALRSKEKPRTQKMHMIRQLLQSFQSRGTTAPPPPRPRANAVMRIVPCYLPVDGLRWCLQASRTCRRRTT